MNKLACSVAIVIPAFNAERYIQQTLLSILASTFRDYVVVVVNDGSTDNTEQVVRNIVDDRIILINRTNSGMSASRNFGIEVVDSEFVALCDADDLWHPRKLELQIAAMSTWQDVDFCFTEFVKYYDGDDTGEFDRSRVSAELDSALSGYIYHKMILTNWALPSSVIFRRSLWKALGPFSCRNHQTDDWEYFVRASREFKFAKLKSPLVLYRQPVVSLSRRIPTSNSTELMRDSLIMKYGLMSPQGDRCDMNELDRRKYLGNKNFYDLQLSKGNFLVGLFGLLKLVFLRKNKLSTLTTLAKSFKHRIFA